MIETSNRRDSRPRFRAGRTRERLDARQEVSPRPGFDRPRWRKRAGALGLVGLTALTSWVVSSISVWLVPVYVGAMVLIFAVPRTNRPEPSRKDEPGEPSPSEDPPAPASVEGKTAATVEPPTPAVEAEAPDEPPKPKPRKRRVRARKTAKKGANAPDAAASGRVTWVRVGPGKFVRSVVPIAEFVGPPAPDSISDPEPQAPAKTETEAETKTDASTVAVPDVGIVVPEIGSESADVEAGAGESDDSPVPAPVEESTQPGEESPSIADDPRPATELGADEGTCQDLWMNQDDSARLGEATEENASSDPPEAVDVEAGGLAIEHEHESESASLDVSEPIAEEHGNAPSTLGEGPETVSDFETSRDEGPWSPTASLFADEAVVEVEDDFHDPVGILAPERSSPVGLLDSPRMESAGRRGGRGLFFSASLRRPRRTVEPAIARLSRRLGNARRSGASRRATLAGRAVETRVRRRDDATRGHRANIQRDFHPRSPPARS